jgi:Bacterial Ig domain/IPT/TIG domain
MKHIKPQSLAVPVFSVLLILGFFVLGQLVHSSAAKEAGSGEKRRVNERRPSSQQAASPLPKATPIVDPRPASSPTPLPSPKTNEPKRNVAAAKHVGGMHLLSGGGTLTGRMLTSPPPSTINLTSQGTLDWAHWGNGGPAVFNHKNNVSQQISNFSVIGTNPVQWLADNPTAFTWSDGTPTTNAIGVTTGVHVNDLGNGFQFTVPADTNLKTLRVYVGVWMARGRLEASLSDESATTFVDTHLVNQNGTTNGVYTIAFSAASAGQTLTIKYTVQSNYFTPFGNVALEAATLTSGGDPDVFPVVNISAPADEATFNAGDTVNITANAFDPDGSLSAVEFYSGAFLLGTGTLTGTNQYSFTWPNVFAGSYELTAVAVDNEGARTVSDKVNVTALPVSGGSLTGRVYSPPQPHSVDLTATGSLDWAHWGNGSPQAFDHKNGVLQQISNITVIGTSAVNWLDDNPTTFSWTDGTPTATASNNRTGIFVSSAGNGFEITVPADTNLKTVKVYTGFWFSQTKLEATLSDGSAPVYVDTSLGGSTGVVNGIYSITYRAASAGQVLRLRYTVLTDYNPPNGNLALEAVTLASGADTNLPPTVSLTGPTEGSILNANSNITVTASASDSDGSVSKVEFFQGSTKIGEDTSSPYSITWNNVPGGIYSLYAVAYDNQNATSTSAPVNIQVNAAPVVNAGFDQSINLPATASLFGSASDDGLPNPPGAFTVTWSKTSGPGSVSFGNANSLSTTASFSSEGSYVLRLTVNDGSTSSFDEITVDVHTAATVKLNPTADAHVRDGGSASTNFGSATTIEVQSSSTSGENRDAYFKFDLTNVGDISNAKLRINAALSAAGSVAASVYPVNNTSWTEAAINWNNRPALGSPVLNSVTVNGTTAAWYELDVTNYIMGEKAAGRNVVTLALHNQSNSTVRININSKEAASNKPELSIVTPETAFVTGKTLGTVRNNLNAWVGMKVTLGNSPVTVTTLGRIFVSGNSGTHTVKIVNAGTGADVPGASVSINMAAGTATNDFKYVALAAPVTLSANTAYYVASQETSGGDQWYDSNTVLTTTNIGVVNNAVQKPNNNWQSAGSTNNSFGPVDFKYISQAPLPNVTYHLHKEASATSGLFKLDTAGPDAASFPMQTTDLKGQALGEKLINAFDTQAAVLGQAGYLPAGSITTITLWMRNTGTVGTMFPRAKLNLNDAAGTNICTATGSTALTSTLTKYTLTCSNSSDIVTSATDRYYLWVGVNLTAGSSTKSFTAELDIEGTEGGNHDSRIVAPLPVVPTLYTLNPSLGPVGSSTTITGTFLGAMQGSSSVTFNGVTASVSSWSATSVVVVVPASATSGPVVVTVNGIPSNGLLFTVGPADSDADGLPDVWELLYFGNLLQGPTGDPDGDGVNNIQEFLQGRNPMLGAVSDTAGSINLKLHTPIDP